MRLSGLHTPRRAPCGLLGPRRGILGGASRARSLGCAILGALALGACGGPGAPPPTTGSPDEGEGESGPVFAGDRLPALPEPLDPEGEPLDEAWRAGTEALALRPPEAPRGGRLPEVQAWVAEDLRAWMQVEGEAIRAVLLQLREIADQGAEPELQAVTAAMRGQLLLRFARYLAELPAPPAIAAEGGAEARFREALGSAARPLLQRALDAYGSCASVAAAQPAHALSTWRRFCDDRAVRVRRALDGPEGEGPGRGRDRSEDPDEEEEEEGRRR